MAIRIAVQPKYNRSVLRRVLICVVFAIAAGAATRAEARTILVFPFENVSSDRSLDWLGEGISELLLERLQFEPGTYVFPRDERLSAYEKLGIPETTVASRATQLKIGWEIGADKIIVGRFSGTADDFKISAHSIDMELSRASAEVSVRGKLQDIMALTADLGAKMNIGGPVTISHPQSAFENYVRGLLSPDPMKQVSFLETSVRQDPAYVPAILALGHVYHLERDFANSNKSLQKVTSLGPELLQAQFMMGLNYFYLGDYARSIAIFDQLPQTWDVLLNRGAAFSQKGDLPGAIAAWQRAAALDPLRNDAFFNIGYVSLLKNDFDLAIKTLNESLNLRGHDSEALFLLGRAYQRQGRLDESQKFMAQAARLSQRVERWATQPLPKLERVSTTASFTNGEQIWTETRLRRRAKGGDLAEWLDFAQAQIDSYMYGEAMRELRNAIRVFPDAAEARGLLQEVNRQRMIR
jgi:tetratricopeptide (TPR) repeat protein/TolB-like protein